MQYELANRLYVFCPESEKGLEFIIQEIPLSVSKFAGSLPENEFLSSGVKPVKWDEKVNGDISQRSQIGSKNTQPITLVDGSYVADTVIVDKETFSSLLMQIKNPKNHSYNNYLHFTFNNKTNNKDLNVFTKNTNTPNKK